MREEKPHWSESPVKRAQVAAITAVGVPVIAALGSSLTWKVEGLEHLKFEGNGRRPIMAFFHGRVLTATYFFRDRGIVVMISENFDGEWIARIIERFGYGTSRGSTSRGGQRALLRLKRDMDAGPARRVCRRWPARPGAKGSAWRRLACEADREPGRALSHGGVEVTGASTAGTARRFPGRSPPSRLRSGSRSTWPLTPTRLASRRSEWKSSKRCYALEQRAVSVAEPIPDPESLIPKPCHVTDPHPLRLASSTISRRPGIPSASSGAK